jgi:hypothetical protein
VRVSVDGADGADDSATVTCPASNPNVVSGGFESVTGGGQLVVTSAPSAANAWTVILEDTDAIWTAWAICSS